MEKVKHPNGLPSLPAAPSSKASPGVRLRVKGCGFWDRGGSGFRVQGFGCGIFAAKTFVEATCLATGD